MAAFPSTLPEALAKQAQLQDICEMVTLMRHHMATYSKIASSFDEQRPAATPNEKMLEMRDCLFQTKQLIYKLNEEYPKVEDIVQTEIRPPSRKKVVRSHVTSAGTVNALFAAEKHRAFPSGRRRCSMSGFPASKRACRRPDVARRFKEMDVLVAELPPMVVLPRKADQRNFSVEYPGLFRVALTVDILRLPDIYFDSVAAYAANEDVNCATPSGYAIFRRVSLNIALAVDHYLAECGDADVFFSSLVRWLRSFNDMFSAKCTGCNRRLRHGSKGEGLLPPDTRTYDSLEAYHSQCIP